MLLQTYFWLMLIYVVGTLLATPFVIKKSPALARFTSRAWVEQITSYALLGFGLLGVYGQIHAMPIFHAQFWQVFLVGFVVFAGLQHRMPKTKQLRASHGSKAVVVASVIGILMLLPMFAAIATYAFSSPGIWAPGKV